VETARKIGTFETSILPYEDCCTVFTPKHPKTRPTLAEVERAQKSFDFEPYIQKAVEETTSCFITK
jgi:thiamine biosynthesis protein ThiI